MEDLHSHVHGFIIIERGKLESPQRMKTLPSFFRVVKAYAKLNFNGSSNGMLGLTDLFVILLTHRWMDPLVSQMSSAAVVPVFL